MKDGEDRRSNQPVSLVALRHALSEERLAAYGIAGDGDALDPVARYVWNLALTSALMPPLHMVEVTLRNNLFNASRRVVVESALRFVDVECWLDAEPTLLYEAEADAVRMAKGWLPTGTSYWLPPAGTGCPRPLLRRHGCAGTDRTGSRQDRVAGYRGMSEHAALLPLTYRRSPDESESDQGGWRPPSPRAGRFPGATGPPACSGPVRSGPLGRDRKSHKSRNGQIRHRLDPLSSVSAWVSIDHLAELSPHDAVVDIELPQTHRLAAR